MGDYNRVQSYIKSHVLPKLESLPQDVQSVKNAFDAWKAYWTQARAIKLDNLDAKISSRASSQQVDGVRGGVDTTLQGVTELLSKGVVKSVQRGVLQWKPDTNVYGKKVTVNFGQVNPSKTIVLLQPSHGNFEGYYNYNVQASLVSLSETSMKLNVSIYTNDTPDSSSPLYASWQVIEFY